MTKLNLGEMALEELWRLHERISQVLSERILAEKLELEKRLAQLGGNLESNAQGSYRGFATTPAQRGQQRRRYPRVFPKYQNPSNPNETWSGRGKQPRWLVAALKAGGKVDDFRILGPDSKTPARG